MVAHISDFFRPLSDIFIVTGDSASASTWFRFWTGFDKNYRNLLQGQGTSPLLKGNVSQMHFLIIIVSNIRSTAKFGPPPGIRRVVCFRFGQSVKQLQQCLSTASLLISSFALVVAELISSIAVKGECHFLDLVQLWILYHTL